MKKFTNTLLAWSAAGAMLCCTLQVQAQKTSGSGSGVTSDSSFVTKNIKDNQMEVQLSQMAIDKSSNQKIKDLAQKMVDDHTAMMNALQKFGTNQNANSSDAVAGNAKANDSAGAGVSKPGDTASASNVPDIAGTKSSSSTSDTGWHDTASMNMNGSSAGMSMDSTGGKENGMMSPLSNATGTEFDNMWVSEMLAGHKAKLSELTAAASTVKDPELKKTINEAIPKVRMHRDALAALQKGTGMKSGSSSKKSSHHTTSSTSKESTGK